MKNEIPVPTQGLQAASMVSALGFHHLCFIHQILESTHLAPSLTWSWWPFIFNVTHFLLLEFFFGMWIIPLPLPSSVYLTVVSIFQYIVEHHTYYSLLKYMSPFYHECTLVFALPKLLTTRIMNLMSICRLNEQIGEKAMND